MFSCPPDCITGNADSHLTQIRLIRLALPALRPFSPFISIPEGAMLAQEWKTRPMYHQSFSTHHRILSWEPGLGMAPSSACLRPAPFSTSSQDISCHPSHVELQWSLMGFLPSHLFFPQFHSEDQLIFSTMQI